MKYILLLFLAISLIARGQDIVKLSPQEMFDFNSKWNNLGTSQTYIDFSKDILSTSDISFGIVGQQQISHRLANSQRVALRLIS